MPMQKTFTVTKPNSCSEYMASMNDPDGIIAKYTPPGSFLQIASRSKAPTTSLMQVASQYKLSFVENEEKIIPR